jgi:dihydrofolate reductase
MAHLIYSAISSLDGYIEDTDGKFDWAVSDEEVHTFINNLERGFGTYLYGRRLYETMMGWETALVMAWSSSAIQQSSEAPVGTAPARALLSVERITRFL